MAKDDHLDLVGDWDALKPKKPEPAPKPAQGRAGVLDVNELREATRRAIQEGVNKKRAAEDARVAAILQKTTDKARKAAAKGESSCRVMKLVWERDFDYIDSRRGRDGEVKLKGIAKSVRDRLIEASIKVDTEVGGYASHYASQYEDRWLIIKW